LSQKRWDDAPGSLAVALFVQICAALHAFAGLALAEGSLRPPLSGGFLFGLAWLVLLPTFGGYGLYWLGLRHLSAQGGSAAPICTNSTTASDPGASSQRFCNRVA
ncbi:hypothetical protein ACV355_31710, partial [Pseudomonas aeruginosa]